MTKKYEPVLSEMISILKKNDLSPVAALSETTKLLDKARINYANNTAVLQKLSRLKIELSNGTISIPTNTNFLFNHASGAKIPSGPFQEKTNSFSEQSRDIKFLTEDFISRLSEYFDNKQKTLGCQISEGEVNFSLKLLTDEIHYAFSMLFSQGVM